MATMWLLLVNTVKSTGQWYFPGERAQGRGGVKEGAGAGRGQGGCRVGVGWGCGVREREQEPRGSRPGGGTPPGARPGPSPESRNSTPCRTALASAPAHPATLCLGDQPVSPPACCPFDQSAPHTPPQPLSDPAPSRHLRRPSLPRCTPRPGEPVQVSPHRTLQQGGHAEMRDLELHEL